MKLCAITDRKRLSTAAIGEAALRRELRGLVAGWIEGGVDFIQIREKDLGLAEFCSLVNEICAGLDRHRSKLLVNLPQTPEWIRALAPVADGVHFPGELEAGSVNLARTIFRETGRRPAIISVSCHSLEEVHTAVAERVDFVLFAPIFEKVLGETPAPATTLNKQSRSTPAGNVVSGPTGGALQGQGLGRLRAACEAAGEVPVFALGGVTVENASECLAAGAAGVSGIRLFAEDRWLRLVSQRARYS
jgi:thiamine-phosphate pyrophosphorylase